MVFGVPHFVSNLVDLNGVGVFRHDLNALFGVVSDAQAISRVNEFGRVNVGVFVVHTFFDVEGLPVCRQVFHAGFKFVVNAVDARFPVAGVRPGTRAVPFVHIRHGYAVNVHGAFVLAVIIGIRKGLERQKLHYGSKVLCKRSRKFLYAFRNRVDAQNNAAEGVADRSVYNVGNRSDGIVKIINRVKRARRCRRERAIRANDLVRFFDVGLSGVFRFRVQPLVLKSCDISRNDGTAHTVRRENYFFPAVGLNELFKKFGIDPVVDAPVVVENDDVPALFFVSGFQVQTLLTIRGDCAVLNFFACRVCAVSVDDFVGIVIQR